MIEEPAGDDGATIEDYLAARAAMAVATVMVSQNLIYGESLAAAQRQDTALVMWVASDALRPRVAMDALQSPRVMRTSSYR